MQTYYSWTLRSPYASAEFWSITDGKVLYHDHTGSVESNHAGAGGICAQLDGAGRSPERITAARVVEMREAWTRARVGGVRG